MFSDVFGSKHKKRPHHEGEVLEYDNRVAKLEIMENKKENDAVKS
jgi:hypothetical protein